MKEKEYVYDVEEYSQDVRRYQVTSNVKLTHYEVSNVYREADDDKDTKSNLSGFMDWEDERFTFEDYMNYPDKLTPEELKEWDRFMLENE